MTIFRQIFVTSLVIIAAAAKYTGPTNQAGIDLIKDYEGLTLNFYNSSSGKRTIGYGHSCGTLPCSVPIYRKYRVPLTQDSAEALLRDDLGPKGGFEDCVNQSVQYTELNANQFSALVSFVYSVGCDAFKRSELLTKVNGGDIPGAANEFGQWVYNGRRRNKRLSWRRANEMFLFCRVEEETRDLWLCD